MYKLQLKGWDECPSYWRNYVSKLMANNANRFDAPSLISKNLKIDYNARWDHIHTDYVVFDDEETFIIFKLSNL